jgi:hypothetical protein
MTESTARLTACSNRLVIAVRTRPSMPESKRLRAAVRAVTRRRQPLIHQLGQPDPLGEKGTGSSPAEGIRFASEADRHHGSCHGMLASHIVPGQRALDL